MKHGLLMIAAAFLAQACLCAQAAITAPAAPPELPETLKSFRTQVQLEEQEMLKSQQQDTEEADPADVAEAPFVPGDESAGVLRVSDPYMPGQVLGVPDYGMLVVRFFDAGGVPWEIASVKTENPGFTAEVTASPSELMVKQAQGASASGLEVSLAGRSGSLLFVLRPARLENRGIAVTTLLQTVRMDTVQNGKAAVRPEALRFPEPNPQAAAVHFDEQALEGIQKLLLDSVADLKK
ncbi:MAG: DotH/IcmK family type IV secretion protein [Succinivibrio sp.]|nr:DotH/IcmK family type IV secretion protein [Succinivibrio sp.]